MQQAYLIESLLDTESGIVKFKSQPNYDENKKGDVTKKWSRVNSDGSIELLDSLPKREAQILAAAESEIIRKLKVISLQKFL